MIHSNVGSAGVPVGRYSRRDEMAIYDDLAPELRAQLRDMSFPWNPSGVRAITEAHGVETALAVLRKTEADMQAAHRTRLGL